MKILVVDPNVVFSGTLGMGHSLKIFEDNDFKNIFDFISPEYFYVEIGRHTEEIGIRTKFSIESAVKVFTAIVKQIDFISEFEYQDKIEEAREILKGHEKDVPYLALALARDCMILSGDKVLKELCPDKVISPREILDELEKF
tara:strand:- start:1042 stop:1470 length:429 start_codon:yes stop_codon:yes gene_type:complete